MSRIGAREICFKLLFEFEFLKQKNPLTLEEFLLTESENIDNEDLEFIKKVYDGAVEKSAEIEEIISKYLKDYSLNRVYKVDLAILKLAVFELKYFKDTPTNVVINEAVELAKKFSTDNSYKFVNGVLASIIKEEI